MQCANNDIRFFILVLILTKYSSNEKKLNLDQINNYLQYYDCKALGRSTFISHIKKIEEFQSNELWSSFFGEIIREKNKSRNEFNLTNIFEDSELRIITDLIYATKALSNFESEKLIKKLDGLMDVYSSDYKLKYLINKQIIKTDINIGTNISNILNAIKMNKKISFNYCEYDSNKKLICKLDAENKPKVYIAMPIEIFLKKDFYYLVLKKDGKYLYANYRIDKISNLKILDEYINEKIKEFDLVDHINKSVYMFSGDTYDIKLEINKNFRGRIFDELGKHVRITTIGDLNNESGYISKSDRMQVSFKSTIDNGLISWILQLGSSCKVMEPQFLKEKVLLEVQNILKNYE